METLRFDSFTKKIYIKAPIEKLYWCWATKEGLESWLLRKASFADGNGEPRNATERIQAGDSYVWEWHNWNGQEEGIVLQANGTNFLEIIFATPSKVSVTLEDNGKAVLVTLRQYEIPTDEKSMLDIHHGCSNGWSFWLANLKAYLEHGILLNETEFDLTDIPLAGHQFVNM